MLRSYLTNEDDGSRIADQRLSFRVQRSCDTLRAKRWWLLSHLTKMTKTTPKFAAEDPKMPRKSPKCMTGIGLPRKAFCTFPYVLVRSRTMPYDPVRSRTMPYDAVRSRTFSYAFETRVHARTFQPTRTRGGREARRCRPISGRAVRPAPYNRDGRTRGRPLFAPRGAEGGKSEHRRTAVVGNAHRPERPAGRAGRDRDSATENIPPLAG